MTTPETPQDVEAVVLALQSENPILAKDKKGHQSKYADLVQVNEVVLKRLNAWGAIWVCRPTLEDGVFGLHYSLRHIASSTEIAGVWPLRHTDNPQQMGSMVTYGRRYALLAVTGLVSEEDPVDDDGKAASEGDKPRATRTVKRANGPAPEETPEERARKAFTRLHILWTELGMGRERALEWSADELKRETPLASSKDLTVAEVDLLIPKAEALKKG